LANGQLEIETGDSICRDLDIVLTGNAEAIFFDLNAVDATLYRGDAEATLGIGGGGAADASSFTFDRNSGVRDRCVGGVGDRTDDRAVKGLGRALLSSRELHRAKKQEPREAIGSLRSVFHGFPQKAVSIKAHPLQLC